MITSENKIRVRYDEVDKMGYVYHGNYAKYYHISRTELLRKVRISDKELENYNIILPVIEMTIKYLKPVFYDDVITIKTTIKELPTSRMEFFHKVFNQNHEIINVASSTLIFVNSNTRKPMRVPEIILNKLKSYIKTLN
ncbi:MAG: acyl-CoA thioesterase [Bacteroidetes bacterium]|nr:acyl-CoA thioesterase [Bacteroidota bacterium]MBL7103524.1 acyl-CoA thioesterase [Bacteroidales bacterium]